MSRILDEMIQDRVETGHIVRGARGSVRVANDRKRETLGEAAAADLEPLRGSPSVLKEAKQVVLEA